MAKQLKLRNLVFCNSYNKERHYIDTKWIKENKIKNAYVQNNKFMYANLDLSINSIDIHSGLQRWCIEFESYWAVIEFKKEYPDIVEYTKREGLLWVVDVNENTSLGWTPKEKDVKCRVIKNVVGLWWNSINCYEEDIVNGFDVKKFYSRQASGMYTSYTKPNKLDIAILIEFSSYDDMLLFKMSYPSSIQHMYDSLIIQEVI